MRKGQFLVGVGKDENNEMHPIAWVVVQKETGETWAWFIDSLKSFLCIIDGLGSALDNDMQNLYKKHFNCNFYIN